MTSIKNSPKSLKILLLFYLLGSSGLHAQEDDNIVFSADKVSSVLAEGREYTALSGNVDILVNKQNIRANSIEIFGSNRDILIGEGDIKIIDKDNKIFMEGDSFAYDRINKVLRMRGLILIQDEANDVVLRCSYLEYLEDQEILRIQIDVHIINDDIITSSEFGVYKREDQSLELSGNPVVDKGSDRYQSELIFVNLDTREITLDQGVEGNINTEN